MSELTAEMERLFRDPAWRGLEHGPQIAVLLAEIDALRERLDDAEAHARVRGAGCQCGDDEACALLRRAEAVEKALASIDADLDSWPHGKDCSYACCRMHACDCGIGRLQAKIAAVHCQAEGRAAIEGAAPWRA